MPSASTAPRCPTASEWRALLEHPDADAAMRAWETHLRGCRACQATLDGVTGAGDAAATRALAGDATEWAAASPEIERAVRRLRAVPPPAAAPCAEPPPQVEKIHPVEPPPPPDAARPPASWSFPEPPTADAPLGRVGKYAVRARVGGGGGGELFLARDERLGRDVALKVLRPELASQPEARARWEREAQAAAALQHEHVVSLYEVGQAPGFPPFLVLEYVAGESLAERVRKQGPPPPREAARVAREIALALGAAHAKGLIHRDVTPANILLEAATGRAKLTDFGLARPFGSAPTLTQTGVVAGTPAYMSPEQITQPRACDGRSDVYGLGAALYEALTGEPPFRGVTRMLLWQVLNDEPRPPRRLNDAVPRDLETVCLKALAKEPRARYPTARAMADDLDRFLSGRPVLARPVSAAGRAWRWSRRNPLAAGLSAAIALLLMLTAAGALVAALWLRAARDEARAARDRAAQGAAVASRQRDALLATLRKLVFNVQDQLEADEVDLDETQQTLLRLALDGLRELAREADDAQLTERSAAAARVKLGEILLRLDDAEAAAEQFRLAEPLLARLAKQAPLDAELSQLQTTLESARLELAESVDDTREAARLGDEAVARAEQRAARTPDDWAARRHLADAVARRAEFHTSWSDDEHALDHAVVDGERAVKLYRQLVADRANDADARQRLTRAASALGDAYYMLDRSAEARARWQEALTAFAALPSGGEVAGETQHAVFVAHTGLGDLALEADDLDEAEKQFLSAVAAARRVGRDSPDYWNLDEELADAYGAIAEIRAARDDAPGERRYLRQRAQALDRARRLGLVDNEYICADLIGAWLDLARAELDALEVDAAREHVDEAWKRLRASADEGFEGHVLRAVKVRALIARADLLRAEGELASSDDRLREALAELEGLLAAPRGELDPDEREELRELRREVEERLKPVGDREARRGRAHGAWPAAARTPPGGAFVRTSRRQSS